MKLYIPEHEDGITGCTDHHCILKDNSIGMHTNGGCQCVKDIQRLGRIGLDAVRTIRMLRKELVDVVAENERLQKCCTQRGARMQTLKKTLETYYYHNSKGEAWSCWTYICFSNPEFRDWFDKDGVPKA